MADIHSYSCIHSMRRLLSELLFFLRMRIKSICFWHATVESKHIYLVDNYQTNSHKPDDTSRSDKYRLHSGSTQNSYRIPTRGKREKFRNDGVLGILAVAKHYDITSKTLHHE